MSRTINVTKKSRAAVQVTQQNKVASSVSTSIGPSGPPPNLTVGSVSSGPASVEITGVSPDLTINFVLPTLGSFQYIQPAPAFTVPGALGVGSGKARYYLPSAMIITNVITSVGTSPTGASILVDVNKNGTTIFTTQANRPKIAIGEYADLTSIPDVTSISANDYLTIDIDQVGSSIAGENLTVVVVLRYS